VITLAIPKGRLLVKLAPRLRSVGFSDDALDERDRRLLRSNRDESARLLLLKPDDVPTYVEHGAADAGVVGRDVLLERNANVFVPHDLGIGRCRLAVAAPVGQRNARREGRILRVATKYPTITTAHFAAKGEEVEVIYLGGSVEIAPLVGLADCIVDVVETGETLRQNGLEVIETVCDVSAVTVANRVSMKLQRAALTALLDALSVEER
jgi:ATP phosphoribosyltransferase